MRPIQHLPIKMPCEYDPSEGEPDFFYQNFAKPLVEDMIRMTNAGMPIDQEAVEKLRVVIDEVLETVRKTISTNKIIEQFQEQTYPALVKEYKEKVLVSIRTSVDYIKEYNPKNIVHRTYVVNEFLISCDNSRYTKDKWTVADVKKLNMSVDHLFLYSVVDNTLHADHKIVKSAMETLATYQAELWNKPRYEKSNIPVVIPEFNPGSAKQLQELFSMLKIEPITRSKKTGNASWDRDNIEILYKTTDDEELLKLLQAFIDHSFSGIIKNNFLAAFDSFTVDGILHGNIKVFGAKSFRPTSNSPNLLNMPSSKSIYAGPLKKCFVASPRRVIYTADLSALEDRVISNLSGDINKQNIFLEDLDGHSLNACGYFSEEIEEVMGKNTDNVEYVRKFFYMVEEEGNKVLKAIRFRSKAPTFKLAYGGYPDSSTGGVITQEIFDNYHNILYPQITEYREKYVLPTAQKQGYIHLGLGCRIYTDNAGDAIRTLNNATVQFWSILTMIAVNELNYRIKEAGLLDKMDVISTIYDSIYVDVDKDPKVIKWLNDNIIEVLCVDYLENQVVPNAAEGEIGNNFADLFKIKNNASVRDIKKTLKNLT
jgi:hypothetical protein